MTGDASRLKGDAIESPSPCREPAIRREWRSLEAREREDFLSAVLCLYEKRSLFPDRGSMYDDIVFVHQYSGQAGDLAHKHPSFLPWHRWFIHEFERTLQDECGYEGQLPYWDWTVDWQDLAGSSIWDNELGFGSQDDRKVGVSVPGETAGEKCVSGPFKDVKLLHFNLTVRPHCLSRQFQLSKSEDYGTFSGEDMSPDIMGGLARSRDYGSLQYGMERIHDTIHNGVIGDMNTWSSANDPIFWLHHAQLDRLWWIWQKEDPQNRFSEYKNSPAQASFATIYDEMEYLGLFENRTVSEVMRTDTDILCYRY
ncbi:Di-copper centre-containing protein [Thozetella sp. PMI_491]|nr:Di-copper centre-containing protein [Thozetella sp. PMI_491]